MTPVQVKATGGDAWMVIWMRSRKYHLFYIQIMHCFIQKCNDKVSAEGAGGPLLVAAQRSSHSIINLPLPGLT